MDDARMAVALEVALEKLGVEVRIENIAPDARMQGGLCTIHGKRVVLIAIAAPVAERIAVLAGALAQLDTDAIFLAPAVRARIDRAR